MIRLPAQPKYCPYCCHYAVNKHPSKLKNHWYCTNCYRCFNATENPECFLEFWIQPCRFFELQPNDLFRVKDKPSIRIRLPAFKWAFFALQSWDYGSPTGLKEIPADKEVEKIIKITTGDKVLVKLDEKNVYQRNYDVRRPTEGASQTKQTS